MSRFMRFWLRLGFVLAVPVLLAGYALNEPGLWWAIGALAFLYLGFGWAIDGLF